MAKAEAITKEECDFCSVKTPTFQICPNCKNELMLYANEGEKVSIKDTLGLHNQNVFVTLNYLATLLVSLLNHEREGLNVHSKKLMKAIDSATRNYFLGRKHDTLICSREVFKVMIVRLREIENYYEDESLEKKSLNFIISSIKTIMFNQEVFG